jgi:uncharacterized protein (DUF1499 family)
MKIAFLSLLGTFIVLIGWGVYRNRHPRSVGIQAGKLSHCPSTPNCVNSEEVDPIHAINPFPAPKDSSISPINILAQIISKLPKTRLIYQDEAYLHAEFRSKIFSFTDDVEFLLDREHQLLHVRSASRVGYGDWNVNRDRVEMLRKEYLKCINLRSNPLVDKSDS